MIDAGVSGKPKGMTQSRLVLLVSVFITIFLNASFFSNVAKVYGFTLSGLVFMASLFIVLVSLTTFLLTLVSSRYTTKPVLILVLLVSSVVAYFMDAYEVMIDAEMIQNVVETDVAEAGDLMSIKLVLYVLLLGVLPSVYVYRARIKYLTFSREALVRLKSMLIALLLIALCIFPLGKYYASFLREHKPLRYRTNPTYWMFSTGRYLASTQSKPQMVTSIGTDAKVSHPEGDDDSRKELIILVIGEAARADHFSLNGYERQTNPLLATDDVISFSNVHSCGTSTAVSVPCMFSVFGREGFSNKKGESTENILDLLRHTGDIDILWRDNNSSSKGVAARVPYEDFKTSQTNSVCDVECRDEGMLVGLDGYIAAHKGRDILIVMHQMGNHGPAYYKRYPSEFEKFTPACKTNQLENCSEQSIRNAYDNAILYTDYFLHKTIGLLRKYSEDHETALLYISDHGESLGENDVYLHGLPYLMAPDNQTHVAALAWFDGAIRQEIDTNKLRAYRDDQFSHDNLFHTLIGLFEVKTALYDPARDILTGARKPE